MAERTTSHLMGATLLGGLVGASLAILFAPRSGKETRRQIHDRVDDMKDEAQAKLDALNITRKRHRSPVLSAWEEEV